MFSKRARKKLKLLISRGVPFALACTVTICILHPGLWIGFLWTIIHGLIVLGIFTIVCKCMFNKGPFRLLKEGLDKKEEDEDEDDED